MRAVRSTVKKKQQQPASCYLNMRDVSSVMRGEFDGRVEKQEVSAYLGVSVISSAETFYVDHILKRTPRRFR